MPESPISSPGDLQTQSSKPTNSSIPIEIVSEEEMALIEAALAAATSSLSSPIRISKSFSFSSSRLQVNARSIESITFRSKRRLASCSQGEKIKDIEDLGVSGNTQKKSKILDSLLHRFRRNRALTVTDIVASEWCQKQMEFVLVHGRPKASEAMKAGTARHAQLEKEVIQRVEIHVKAIEDSWALKLMNFIVGANQLLFEGLTRELPLVSFVQDVWMVGVIDEIQLPTTGSAQIPYLVENKTRRQATLPSGAQKRNGMLQLMCYKYIWDNIVTNNFPATRFCNFFGLNSQYILSEEIQNLAATSGFPAKTLDDIIMYYRNTCATLSPASDELLLRYEFQGDHSLLGEEKFTYDSAWLMTQINSSLEFWLGERQPSFVAEEETWKCRHCKFASICPNTSTETTQEDEYPNSSTESTVILADEHPTTSMENTTFGADEHATTNLEEATLRAGDQ